MAGRKRYVGESIACNGGDEGPNKTLKGRNLVS